MLTLHSSPLLEKQAILFAVRKRMIGRRAYTDSICKKEKALSKESDAESRSSSSREGSPKLTSSPSQDELDRKATLKDEEEEDRQREKVKKEGNKKKRETLASILGIDNLGEMASADQALHNALMALDNVPQSYTVALPTTEYKETVVLKDAVLPDNNRVRRNFAQDELHNKMVNSQYEN